MNNYNCIYCGKLFNVLEEFKSHFIVHPEVNDKDKFILLSDFVQQLNRMEKIKKATLIKKEENLLLEIKKNKETVSLIEYKSKLINILIEFNVKPHLIKYFNKTKTFKMVYAYISSQLNEEIREEIRKNGISYLVPTKPKKNKTKQSGNYNDETISSIKPIYTPMGNKR